MGNRGSAAVETRTIEIGKYDGKTFPDNRVISYKYTAWNFLFKNLFEQFRRVANFYFLCMGIIAAVIPDSPVTSWATLFPLIFVVTVSAIKQGYEDYRRHKADNKINNSLVTVVRDGVVQEIRCKKVCVGDIVKVGADMDIPCDLVMLISSHPDSKGFITTANLDGETNLKTVECPIDTDLNVDHLPHLKGTITCEPPTVDLYGFHGNITLSLTQGEGDMETFNPVFVKDGYAMDTINGDSCKGHHRISFSKIHFLAQREYTAPLNATNLLLRGSRLRNTEFVFGCAVYTGKETKLALNSTLTINKFSTIEKSVNRFLLFFVILLMVEVLSSVFLTFCFERRFGTPDKWYLGPMEHVTVKDVLNDIFVYFVLYYYIIPISLYVTIELQRFLGTFFFEWDLEMFCNEQSAICNTSDLNEELGQVQYLFSDKTGTLTENDMKFRRCSIEGSMFVETKGELMLLPPSGVLPTQLPISCWAPEVEQFLLAMALCHCVQTRGEMNGQGLPQDSRKVPEYQASSPDEKALVLAASRCGVVFLGTEGGYASVSVRGQIKKFKKLQTLEFSSDRKRMSVVVSDSDDQVWLFCKGAESTMMPLMVSGHREETIRHYTDFSLRGLRTLVLGLRKMDTGEYLRLAQAIRVARSTIDVTAREARLTEVFNDFECSLHLQGATAVEDRLQDRVPETLELLRSAGIKVWVLTGDKVETALNIAYSCGHFKQGTRRLDLYDLTSETECLNTLQEFRCQMEEESLAQYGLVVDGTAVRLALMHDQALLCQIACNCTTVLCCRLSPKQKAEIVSLVKRTKGRPIVAAVGDGANDVSMIQEANIGLGIMGKEGRQAVRCSDFGFAKFHCLARALLVHGHWFYLRGATLVQYFFYKNIVFITPQVYFSLLNGESPQPIYLSVYLMLYNTIFSASPIVMYALFEQNYSDSVLLSRPELYKLHRYNSLMSWGHFFQWMAVGLWHSLVVYFVPVLILGVNSVFLSNSSPMDTSAFGVTVLHNIIIVVNLKLAIHSSYWTQLFIISEIVSISSFIIFSYVYNKIFIVTTRQSLYYVYSQLIVSPNFWLLSLLSVVISFLPDIILKVLQNQRFRRLQLPSWLPTRRKGVFVLPTLRGAKP